MMKKYPHTLSQRFQVGASTLGAIFYIFLIFGAIGLTVKVFPSLSEYMAIKQSVKSIAATPTAASARLAFDQAGQVNNITSISGRDLDIVSDGTNLDIRFSYRKEIQLIGPVALVINYSGGTQ